MNINESINAARALYREGDTDNALYQLLYVVKRLHRQGQEQAVQIETLQAQIKRVNDLYPATALHEDDLCKCGKLKSDLSLRCEDCRQ